MLVIRESERVRLFPRNGSDWTKRSVGRRGRIEEPAQAFRHRWRSRDPRRRRHLRFQRPPLPKHDHEVQLYAFDILAMGGDDLRPLPLHMQKANLESWRADLTGSLSRRSSVARSGQTYSARRVAWTLKVSKHGDRPYRRGRQTFWIRSRTEAIQQWSASYELLSERLNTAMRRSSCHSSTAWPSLSCLARALAASSSGQRNSIRSLMWSSSPRT
ncbi:hypothetical protein [Bradyrhizobium sp. UFLA05-153]